MHYSRFQDFSDKCIIIGVYIVIYQDGPILHCTHVPDPFYQSSAES